MKFLGWLYRAYIKTMENGAFFEELLNENDFEAVLATFCCYDDGTNPSEAVRKIAWDQRGYHKCSSCVIICWIAKIYHQLTAKKVRYYDTSNVERTEGFRSCTEKRTITAPLWVLSIMEKRQQLWWRIALKPKTQSPKKHF